MANSAIDNNTINTLTEVAATNSGLIAPNIYDIAKYVELIKAKHIDIPEDTLALGIYGYLNEIHSNILENTAVIAAEYSNEAVPTKAQFERNVIAHALSLGINNIMATPAAFKTYICLPEEAVIKNMVDDKLVLDKEYEFNISSSNNSTGTTYIYRLDYDIIIRRSKLPNGKWVYTAIYDIDKDTKVNPISSVTNPYLPTVGIIKISNDNMIVITTTLRQYVHNKTYKKILVNNPLESKSLTFTFPDQLSYFYVEVNEGDKFHRLRCIYDGLYTTLPNEEYCNYQYIDDTTIRIVFNRDSYQPRTNADVTVHAFTTNGDACNFIYKAQTIHTLSSERYAYNNLYAVLQPLTNSEGAVNKKSISEIKQIIPKEMLGRSTITTTKDLRGYFNQISDHYKMVFLEKLHNQISRIFFSYILLKNDNNNVIPTNTLDVLFGKDIFQNINSTNYILPQGSVFVNTGKGTQGYPYNTPDAQIKKYQETSFVYTNPFLIVINKNPFLVNYYLNIMDYSKSVNFIGINEKCQLQFIPDESIKVKRESLSRDDNIRNTYRISFSVMQNISSDFNIIGTDEEGNITRQDIRVYGVLYNKNILKDGTVTYSPYRYMRANPLIKGDFDDESYTYNFELDLKTTDIIDKNQKLHISKGLYNLGTNDENSGVLTANIKLRFFVLVKLDTDYGRELTMLNDGVMGQIDDIVPNLQGWTLCNIYEMETGLDVYYNYTNIMESYISLRADRGNGGYSFDLKRVPLVRYSYFNNSETINQFVRLIDIRRSYIQACLVLLEDSFGVDFKFFNTYGPSKKYNVNQEVYLDRVNISLKFEVKYRTLDAVDITSEITDYIKSYVEDLNYVNDLHIPNLTTNIKNKFSKQLTYFKFVGLNNYGYMYQSLYQNPENQFVDSTDVPEFINVDTKEDGSSDITYTIASVTNDDLITNNII